MYFLVKLLLGLFCYRKPPNSGIPQILVWLQKEMEMFLLYNGFGTFRNMQQKGVVIQLGVINLMEDRGLFEQHVLKLNLSEGKAKKSLDRRNMQPCEGRMAAREIHLKKTTQRNLAFLGTSLSATIRVRKI